MAQAICNEEIARRLGISTDRFSDSPVRALSAGLSVESGSPLSSPARAALDHLGVRPHEHASREVTPDLVGQAELILCMTESQRRTLVERFPEAASKTSCLNPDGDIEDPSGQDEDAFRRLAERLQHLVRQRVQALTS